MDRYVRQEIFIGKKEQKKLEKSKVVVIGLGALGSLTSELLVRAGIGEITLVDKDKIEIENLQRQHLYSEKDVGKYKVKVAKKKLCEINSNVIVKVIVDMLNEDNLNVLESDLVLDCTDNFEARFLINKYCVRHKIPWIYASAIRDKGNVLVVKNLCFNCVFGYRKTFEKCASVGILNTITSLVSSVQVNEALKLLTGKKYEKELLRFDLGSNEFTKVKVSKKKNCEVCG
nr:hypothetical protein [Nanoarchaeum sp.]